MAGNVVAIVPAAGKGSRLWPFPCPKELFPVGYQDIDIKGAMEKRPKVTIILGLITSICRSK